jgi:hypothetical protein
MHEKGGGDKVPQSKVRAVTLMHETSVFDMHICFNLIQLIGFSVGRWVNMLYDAAGSTTRSEFQLKNER